ncbi:class I SAM-dependent methyltransferase [Nocardia otitidiscaviarum]|uniref:class I SAM-dependent methyltransferase n=1 Tax=Nocardia otitidiscaviarum TaxID=1823 RepID=UPI001894CAE4|nr:class I SAM-dependent methyltransferase [Nocardia otitidiscaviarum]MBF6180414.1 class I SAM-dependent methyltransferase [Nocardia otitidiscaviarum]
MPVSLHSTGKASFDHIYDRPDPREYYARMAELDYCIPELATPHFASLIADYRAATGIAAPTVLDLGCSYGVNAALLRLGISMAELTEHYRDADSDGDGDDGAAALIARDRARLTTADRLPGVRFIGMDASRPALDYARAAGLLHDTVHADLEAADPTEAQRATLATADLVISTGCVGYITDRTLLRVARAHGGKLPWMAHFVLRMFSFDPIAARLAELGYRTERVPGSFRQRRFAAADERTQVLNTLADNGVDTEGHESDGWLYAQLYVSRPSPTLSFDHEDLS